MHTRYRSWRGDKTFSERSSKVINNIYSKVKNIQDTTYKKAPRERCRVLTEIQLIKKL